MLAIGHWAEAEAKYPKTISKFRASNPKSPKPSTLPRLRGLEDPGLNPDIRAEDAFFFFFLFVCVCVATQRCHLKKSGFRVWGLGFGFWVVGFRV